MFLNAMGTPMCMGSSKFKNLIFPPRPTISQTMWLMNKNKQRSIEAQLSRMNRHEVVHKINVKQM